MTKEDILKENMCKREFLNTLAQCLKQNKGDINAVAKSIIDFANKQRTHWQTAGEYAYSRMQEYLLDSFGISLEGRTSLMCVTIKLQNAVKNDWINTDIWSVNRLLTKKGLDTEMEWQSIIEEE